MANVNLLPWREIQRQEKKKEFLIVLGMVAAVALLLAVLWGYWVNWQIDGQNDRNDLLKREIAVLDEKVKEIKELKLRRQQVLERMEVIKALQGNRPGVVKVFDEFVRSVPSGVFFVEVKRVGDNVALVGFAESNNRISTLMRQLDTSDRFKEPNLTKVEADDTLGEQGSRFELQVRLDMTSDEDKIEGEGV
ncbi:MAG: PilN domain-containing protein [Gammaproteobacteria bacterium]|nr:PilN domain-containing protein [Gammaproteobacteria bacterium]MBQ0838417.1 PilN domain-containing protein [Gammaproteobacteria bacterium]